MTESIRDLQQHEGRTSLGMCLRSLYFLSSVQDGLKLESQLSPGGCLACHPPDLVSRQDSASLICSPSTVFPRFRENFLISGIADIKPGVSLFDISFSNN